MQHAFGRAFVAAALSIPILAACVPRAASAALPESPWLEVASCLGPGAAALWDEAASLCLDPATLALAPRREARLQYGSAPGLGMVQRFGLVLPMDGPAIGLGHTRRRFESSDPALVEDRQDWRVGLAQTLRPGIAFGGSIRLSTHATAGSLDASYGADLGLHLQPGWIDAGAAGSSLWNRLAFGVTLRNALRPRLRLAAGSRLEARRLEAAVACGLRPRPDWKADLTLGLAAAEAEPGAAWLGMRLCWRQALEVAVGSSSGELRLGAGAARGPLRLDYSLAPESGGALQALALHVGFGSTREARREAHRRDDAARFAVRLQREMAARDTLEVQAWLEEAACAEKARQPERAANLYGNVLARRAGEPAATAGLRRARFEALLQQADTLLARGESAHAGWILEQALDLFPADSLSAARLESARLAARRTSSRHAAADEQFHLGIDALFERRWADAERSFRITLELEDAHPGAARYLRLAEQGLEEQQQTERRAQAQQTWERERQERRLAEAQRPPAARSSEDHAPPAGPLPVVSGGYELGVQLYRAGDLIGAMRSWEDVAAQAPHYRDVDRYLLRVYRVCGLESYTEGRLQDAIDIWDKALRLEPDNEQVRRYLNQAHAKLQRTQSSAERGR